MNMDPAVARELFQYANAQRAKAYQRLMKLLVDDRAEQVNTDAARSLVAAWATAAQDLYQAASQQQQPEKPKETTHDDQ